MNERSQISIRGTTHTRLKTYAESQGRTMASLIEEWVQLYAPFTDQLPPKLTGYRNKPVSKKKPKSRKRKKTPSRKKASVQPNKTAPSPKQSPGAVPQPPSPPPEMKALPDGLERYREKTPTGGGYGEF